MSSYDTKRSIDDIRAEAQYVKDNIEQSREASLAITKLEEAALWLGQLYERQQDQEFGDD